MFTEIYDFPLHRPRIFPGHSEGSGSRKQIKTNGPFYDAVTLAAVKSLGKTNTREIDGRKGCCRPLASEVKIWLYCWTATERVFFLFSNFLNGLTPKSDRKFVGCSGRINFDRSAP